MNHEFKIRSRKFVNETDNLYIFASSKNGMKNVFSIPKNQVLKFEKTKTLNHHTKIHEEWIEISVTDWIWKEGKLSDELDRYRASSTVVVKNETHFGINWDFVIMKRKNVHSCFFCHEKLDKENKTKDHLIPRTILAAYGYDKGLANNKVPCCRVCNKEKGSLHPEIYGELVRRKIANTGNPKYRIIMFTLNQVLKIN